MKEKKLEINLNYRINRLKKMLEGEIFAKQIQEEVNKQVLEDLRKMCEKQINKAGYPLKGL